MVKIVTYILRNLCRVMRNNRNNLLLSMTAKYGMFLTFVMFSIVFSSHPAQAARDYIVVVGSSTVYPFASVVAEHYGKMNGVKTPKVEATGTGGGFKQFCGGIGPTYPDINDGSRAIKESETKTCAENGVKDILEIKIGFDGIVIAGAKTAANFSLTKKELFLALAREVPDPDAPNSLIINPYKTWREINANLPDTKIEVLGPPPTSGTRDTFVELVLAQGAEEFASLHALKQANPKAYARISETIREDGGYVETGENDNLVVQKLKGNATALGIFGFSYLEQNRDAIKGAMIEGQMPTVDTIADGSYPLSRPLYVYVKLAHIAMLPGIIGFLNELTSERAIGRVGYLVPKGLVPLPEPERKGMAERVKALLSGLPTQTKFMPSQYKAESPGNGT